MHVYFDWSNPVVMKRVILDLFPAARNLKKSSIEDRHVNKCMWLSSRCGFGTGGDCPGSNRSLSRKRCKKTTGAPRVPRVTPPSSTVCASVQYFLARQLGLAFMAHTWTCTTPSNSIPAGAFSWAASRHQALFL